MIRVLHSIFSVRPETGGPARSVPALVAELGRAGVDARLNVGERGTGRSAGAQWRAGGFAPDLGDWSPEVIHDHGLWLPTNHQAAAASRQRGIPLVVSPRGMLEPWSMSHRRWKKKAAWMLYQRRDLAGAKCLHATSPQEAQSFRGLGLRQPVIVLANGVSLPEAMPARGAGDRTERVILFMSRIHPKKGLPLLIEAWRRLRRPGWKIRIVGPDEGGHAEEVRQLASRAGVSGEVEVEAPVDDARKWAVLSAADVFILPTYSENFGIAVAEALAAGVPVITTTGTPWTELGRWGAGWCVAPEVEAIEGALRSAVDLPDEERAMMGSRGRNVVLEQYSWPAIARQMRACYSWILGGGDPPDCIQFG